jgi:hypothetical protein
MDAPPSHAALVPSAIAFRDSRHGILGTGMSLCGAAAPFACRASGTISVTLDGGRSWRLVAHTPRPVASVTDADDVEGAVLDDGEHLASIDDGRTWRPSAAMRPPTAPCPYASFGEVVGSWALCAGQPGAGNQAKAIYRLERSRWRRIAWTPLVGAGKQHGGISSFGYPEGFAMAEDGFGLIWESRGTLYVTRNGGSRWTALPSVERPEIDSGVSGVALRDGVGFVLLARGSGFKTRRLLETTDAGRTWRVVHRWL